MNKDELELILSDHLKFIHGYNGGKRADLRGADLYGADLRGADLRGADLRGAGLHRADLHRADLRGADLRGADLSEADLSKADLSEAKGIISFGPIGNEGRIGYAITGKTTTIHLGCHSDNLPETLSAIEKKYGPDSAYTALVVAAVRALEETETANPVIAPLALDEAPSTVNRETGA